nr:HD domain-containing protein [uncultured Acetatifactor sp.]
MKGLERQYTRVDTVRQYVDGMLNNLTDPDERRAGYVHLYGVGQAGALIALRRGHDRECAELAQIAGMLHDFAAYRDGIRENHAESSSVEAGKILREAGCFTAEEIALVCHAIGKHSDKEQTDAAFDEILKDADVMQHWLRNPMEEYYFRMDRTRRIAREFGLVRE